MNPTLTPTPAATRSSPERLWRFQQGADPTTVLPTTRPWHKVPVSKAPVSKAPEQPISLATLLQKCSGFIDNNTPHSNCKFHNDKVTIALKVYKKKQDLAICVNNALSTEEVTQFRDFCARYSSLYIVIESKPLIKGFPSCVDDIDTYDQFKYVLFDRTVHVYANGVASLTIPQFINGKEMKVIALICIYAPSGQKYLMIKDKYSGGEYCHFPYGSVRRNEYVPSDKIHTKTVRSFIEGELGLDAPEGDCLWNLGEISKTVYVGNRVLPTEMTIVGCNMSFDETVWGMLVDHLNARSYHLIPLDDFVKEKSDNKYLKSIRSSKSYPNLILLDHIQGVLLETAPSDYAPFHRGDAKRVIVHHKEATSSIQTDTMREFLHSNLSS